MKTKVVFAVAAVVLLASLNPLHSSWSCGGENYQTSNDCWTYWNCVCEEEYESCDTSCRSDGPPELGCLQWCRSYNFQCLRSAHNACFTTGPV